MIRQASFAAAGLLLACGALAGDLFSAGQPDEAKIAEYAEQGYTTIIDLRGVDEKRGFDEASAVADAGMDYVLLPVTTRQAVSFANASKLDSLIEQADGPVVVHCASGNRVGALLALRASLNGASDKEALAIGEEFGMTRLRRVVEKVLAEKE